MEIQKINIAALQVAAQEQGIQTCKLVVKTIIKTIRSAREIFADNKVKFLEWLQLIEIGSDIAKVAADWGDFIAELGNLSAQELNELCDFAADELGLASDSAYYFLTKALPDLVNGILSVVHIVTKK